MNITDVWMRLEALAHLRELPQYSAIKKQIEGELAAYNDSIGQPKAVPAPTADVPAVDGSTTAVERRL